MVQIKRFEDIEAWKKARRLVNEIYRVTRKGALSKDFSLKDQIRRAAVSVMSNIAEGFSRQTDREFTQFLYIWPRGRFQRFRANCMSQAILIISAKRNSLGCITMPMK